MIARSPRVWLRLSLVLTISVMLMGPLVWADDTDTLGSAEKKLFNRDFASESVEDRLGRLEGVILGQPQTGGTAQRLQRLQEILSQNSLLTETEKKPSEGDSPSASNTSEAPSPPQQDATDYPAVSQLEQSVFRQAYVNEPISKRLSRLEEHTFHQTFENLPMVDRVDQLTLKLMPNSPLGVEENQNSHLPQTGGELAPSSFAVYARLTALEEKITGRSFGGELISHRLSRMERQVFGVPQHGSIDTRMDNLLTRYQQTQQNQQSQQAYVGQPQAYSPNLPSTLQADGSQAQPDDPASGNMQQFSPDFLKMLPSNVRKQFQNRGMGAIGRTAGPQYGASSSAQVQPYVVVPGQMYRAPGQIAPGSGYAYGVPTMPGTRSQNPWNYPGGALPPLNLGPPNSGMPQGYSSPQANATNPYSQSMLMLENRFFGQTFEGQSVDYRLNRLENIVFGMTYPQYSYDQRINRLLLQSGYHQS